MSGGGGSSKPNPNPAPAADPAAALPVYGNMPQQVTFPGFFPGQQDALSQQMAAGFGGTPQSYSSQLAALNKPTTVTHLKEPITTTMQALGIPYKGPADLAKPGKATGQPGSVSTGSPLLDELLGIKPAGTVPGATPKPVAKPTTNPASGGDPFDPWNNPLMPGKLGGL